MFGWWPLSPSHERIVRLLNNQQQLIHRIGRQRDQAMKGWRRALDREDVYKAMYLELKARVVK